MNWEAELEKIFSHPAFDDVKPQAAQITSNDRLVISFEEINNFFEMHNRLPDNSGDLKEKTLAKRFEAIVSDIQKTQQCMSYDRFGILKSKEMDIDAELQAIFENPIFATTSETASIFDVPKHLQKEVDKTLPDFIAQRTKCEDFDQYDLGFKKVHKELKNGKRTLIRFQESHLKEGTYFLVSGVLVLLVKIYETKKDKNQRLNGRTLCIFENGTQSNLLLRSLAKAIYLDGYSVRESRESEIQKFKERFSPNASDTATGYIYVLKSKSENPVIAQYKDLYKIGFTTGSVEERIVNASQESTYLLDEVEVVASWKTYNLNISHFENMLHKLFRNAQFQVKIHHHSGTVIIPKEWFIVPLPVIQKAIECIIQDIPISYHAKEQLIEVHTPEKFISKIDTSKLKILTLNIKDVYFNEILKGTKDKEYRRIKPNTINTYTYIDPADGKRWLRKYDAIRFFVGYKKNRGSALIEVTNIEFDKDSNTVVYSLGRIIESNVEIGK